jgi:UDP-N-acetylglucosamine--N-acetylmuramyl-(pentapeptide) pyrophosphoryl-undecaprenol N-acetylglucosamine transferase
MIRRVILAGGGTGGHLFPGLAVIEELSRRRSSIEVLYVGTERGIEARVIPARGERLELLDVTPLKGQSKLQLLKSVGLLPRAMGQAASIVRRFGPDLVIGVGGYASGPMLAAAAALGVPTAILEQNVQVGLTNRILSPLVGRAYVSFGETASRFRDGRVRVAGNPIRKALVAPAPRARVDPLGFESRSRDILVIGGSQGARSLNEGVPEALAMAGLDVRGIRVVHQTGESMRDEVAARYQKLGVEARVEPFIADMAGAYQRAALVIARAGASTVAELCAVGRPAILVPFPHAADDHQTKNAKALEAEGAVVTVAESELEAASFGALVRDLLDHPERRREMAEAARHHGRPDAAANIVDDLFEWLEGSSDTEPRPGREDGREEDESSGRGPTHGLRSVDAYVPRHRVSAQKPLVVDGAAWSFSGKPSAIC